ncbi:MAG: MotA/TolQ/ExbB proton channel family protein [Myxococcaceae bacterium]
MAELKDSGFFQTINRSALAMSQSVAGAGVVGVLGFLAIALIAGVFFITENFFISLLLLSLALLVYATGSEVGKLLVSLVTIFFSSKHLTPKATQLQETLVALQDALALRWDPNGEIRVGPLEKGTRLRLPDNPLVRDLKAVFDKGKDYEYAEYVAHSYYVECHELYDHSAVNLEFVSGSMPLFGLMGTVLGLISMFDSLGNVVSVEALSPQLALALKTTLYGALYSSLYKILASRFDQRMRALDYDFDTLCRGLQVMHESKAVIEVQR